MIEVARSGLANSLWRFGCAPVASLVEKASRGTQAGELVRHHGRCRAFIWRIVGTIVCWVRRAVCSVALVVWVGVVSRAVAAAPVFRSPSWYVYSGGRSLAHAKRHRVRPGGVFRHCQSKPLRAVVAKWKIAGLGVGVAYDAIIDVAWGDRDFSGTRSEQVFASHREAFDFTGFLLSSATGTRRRVPDGRYRYALRLKGRVRRSSSIVTAPKPC